LLIFIIIEVFCFNVGHILSNHICEEKMRSVRNQDQQPSEPARHQPIWKIAECAAVGASVVGVFVSAISSQVVYVAAPVSLSLCLNLLNRYRWEKQTQLVSGVTARLYRRMDEIEQQGLASPSGSTPTWEAIQEVRELTEQRIRKLIHEQSQLHLRLSQVTTQTADLDLNYRQQQFKTNELPESNYNGSQNGHSATLALNTPALEELQSRIGQIERLDLVNQIKAQEAAIAQIHERLTGFEGLEIENQLLEVLQVHLRLYKWQQELTAEINQRLTPVVVEMEMGKQRQLQLEHKIAKFAANGSGDRSV
jgi:hypothetical protein